MKLLRKLLSPAMLAAAAAVIAAIISIIIAAVVIAVIVVIVVIIVIIVVVIIIGVVCVSISILAIGGDGCGGYLSSSGWPVTIRAPLQASGRRACSGARCACAAKGVRLRGDLRGQHRIGERAGCGKILRSRQKP